jgi:Fe-S-cluster containining protein
MNTETRDEIAEGLRYVHFRADANTSKLVEVASFMYAAIDLLKEKGLLDIEELDERKREATKNLVAKFSERGMGVVYQKPEQDKYAFEAGARIDCENRLEKCKAACCKLPFALSKQDVEEGVVRWDFSAPYIIAHKPDGYCQHLDQEKKCCSVYAQRPVPCRGYDCRKDKRIWSDFENYVINPRINEPGWPQGVADERLKTGDHD